MCDPISATLAVLGAGGAALQARQQKKAQKAAGEQAEAARLEAERLFQQQEGANNRAEQARRDADKPKTAPSLLPPSSRNPQRGFGLRLFPSEGNASGLSGGSGAPSTSPRTPTLGL